MGVCFLFLTLISDLSYLTRSRTSVPRRPSVTCYTVSPDGTYPHSKKGVFVKTHSLCREERIEPEKKSNNNVKRNM